MQAAIKAVCLRLYSAEPVDSISSVIIMVTEITVELLNSEIEFIMGKIKNCKQFGKENTHAVSEKFENIKNLFKKQQEIIQQNN